MPTRNRPKSKRQSGPCDICGPGKVLHTICHPTIYRRNGCGHPLKAHSPQLVCGVCHQDCGRNADHQSIRLRKEGKA